MARSTLSKASKRGPDPGKTVLNTILLLFGLVPIFIIANLINNYSLNIPYWDDWDAVLQFLSSWSNSDLSQKLSLLFSQHNEHRLLSSRIVYLLYNHLFHKINFVGLIYLGNFQLPVIAFVLIYFSHKLLNNFWALSALIVSFCLFDPSSYENSNFAMAGMANYGIIMLFSVSLFFYSLKHTKLYLFLALLFQFLCAFSSGNGFMAGIALVFFNFFHKDKTKSFACLAGFIVFTFLYFLFYQSAATDLTSKNVMDSISFFLKLSGSHFGYESRITVSVLSFTILGVCLFYKKEKIIFEKLFPFFSILLFILLSMGSIALFRSGGKEGIDHDSYGSRYLIYPHLFSAIIFIILSLRLEKTKLRWIIIGVCSLLFIKAYKLNYEYGEKGFERANYRLNNNNYYHPDTLYAKKIAIDVCQKKIYCIEENRPK